MPSSLSFPLVLLSLLFVSASIRCTVEAFCIIETAKIFGVVGGLMSTLLGLNAKMGNSIYVSTLEEAKNRLKLDIVEGLMARQDVRFIMVTDNLQGFGGKYEACNGVVAAIDCQLQNCNLSNNPRKYGSLPPHVHIKNLYVDRPFHRGGVTKELMRKVEEYATKTKVEMITLAVEDNNIAAMNLYKDLGYDSESIGKTLAQGK